MLLFAVEHSGIDPLGHPFLTALHGQVPVLGGPQLRLAAAERAARIDKVLRAERAAALLALVAVSIGVTTVGAGTDDVTVSEELLGLGVVVLLLGVLRKGAVLIQLEEEILRGLLVQLAAGAVVDVEFDPEVREGLPHHRVVLVHDGLRRGAFLQGAQGDGSAVLIASADKEHLLATCLQVAHIDVGRQVGPGNVADVQGAVSIGQRGGDGGTGGGLHAKPRKYGGAPEVPLRIELQRTQRAQRNCRRSTVFWTAEACLRPRRAQRGHRRYRFGLNRNARNERNENPPTYGLPGRTSYKPHRGCGCRACGPHGVDAVRQAA